MHRLQSYFPATVCPSLGFQSSLPKIHIQAYDFLLSPSPVAQSRQKSRILIGIRHKAVHGQSVCEKHGVREGSVGFFTIEILRNFSLLSVL